MSSKIYFGMMAIAVFLAVQNNSFAAVVDIPSHDRDGDVRDYGFDWSDETDMAVGRAGGLVGQPVPDNSSIMFFQLPHVASGADILAANLQVSLYLKRNLVSGENVDLYGLGYVSTLPPVNSIPPSWYFSGTLDGRTGNDLGTNIGTSAVDKLADDFLVPATPLGSVETDDATDASMLTFIRGVYDSHGAQGGDYLVLRMNANQVFNANYHRYRFYTRDNADANTWPVLSLTTVPEPSGFITVLGLLVCCVSFSLIWNRR